MFYIIHHAAQSNTPFSGSVVKIKLQAAGGHGRLRVHYHSCHPGPVSRTRSSLSPTTVYLRRRVDHDPVAGHHVAGARLRPGYHYDALVTHPYPSPVSAP